MSFESTVYTRLSGDSTLTALCPRLYPARPVDNVALPFMWYSFRRSDYLVFGAVASGISSYQFEVNCFAATQAAVTAIANRIIALLDGYTSAPNVGSCVLSDEAQTLRTTDGYVYFVKSLRFSGLGV